MSSYLRVAASIATAELLSRWTCRAPVESTTTAVPAHAEFADVPDAEPAALSLPVPEHLHYCWVTLWLDAD